MYTVHVYMGPNVLEYLPRSWYERIMHMRGVHVSVRVMCMY